MRLRSNGGSAWAVLVLAAPRSAGVVFFFFFFFFFSTLPQEGIQTPRCTPLGRARKVAPPEVPPPRHRHWWRPRQPRLPRARPRQLCWRGPPAAAPPPCGQTPRQPWLPRARPRRFRWRGPQTAAPPPCGQTPGVAPPGVAPPGVSPPRHRHWWLLRVRSRLPRCAPGVGLPCRWPRSRQSRGAWETCSAEPLGQAPEVAPPRGVAPPEVAPPRHRRWWLLRARPR